MKWYKSFRIRIFILLLVLMIASLSVFSVLITEQVSKLVKEEAYKDIANDDVALRNLIELNLAEIELSIDQIANSDAAIKLNFEQVDQMSQHLIRKLSAITQIYIMNKEGMQIYKSSYPETIGDRSDRDYFIGAIAGKSIFSDVIVSRSTGVPIVVYAQPIIRNGMIEGVIGASIDLGFLSTVSSNIRSSSESYGFIVDGLGRTIGHPDQQFVAEMRDLSNIEPVEAVISGKTGVGRYMLEKHEKLVAYSPLEKTNWGILVQVPEKEAFRSVAIIRQLLYASAFGIFLLSVIATYLISRYLQKPISDIIGKIKSVESNRLYPLYCSLRGDEFGIIEDALVSMADSLNQAHNGLEKRVELRTKELKGAMGELIETQEELMQSNENLGETIEQLKFAHQRITQVEKMAALGRMTSSLAHGINTPLGTALTTITYLEQILAEMKNSQKNDEVSVSTWSRQLDESNSAIDLIHRQIIKAIELMDVVNKPALINEDDDKQDLDLCVYLNEKLEELKFPLIGTPHLLTLNCDVGNATILFPDKLLQILNILIVNSVEHGFANQEYGVMAISVAQSETSIRLLFKNNGMTIKDSELAHIFEPFYKVNMGGRGKGLGLMIAYTLVKEFLNGEITCRNLEPMGVEFTIEFPWKPRYIFKQGGSL